MAAAAIVLSAVSIASGIIQAAAAAKRRKALSREQDRLLAQRKTYKTPSETYEILNAAENRAQSGLDPATLAYLTGESNNAFGSALSVAQYLRADPNSLSGIYDQHLNNIIKIGAENHNQNMKNFTGYIGALGAVGESKDAEWLSRDNLLKDQMQAKQADINFAAASEQSGYNTAISGVSNLATALLYNTGDGTGSKKFKDFYGEEKGAEMAQYAKDHGLSFEQYQKNFKTMADSMF